MLSNVCFSNECVARFKWWGGGIKSAYLKTNEKYIKSNKNVIFNDWKWNACACRQNVIATNATILLNKIINYPALASEMTHFRVLAGHRSDTSCSIFRCFQRLQLSLFIWFLFSVCCSRSLLFSFGCFYVHFIQEIIASDKQCTHQYTGWLWTWY